MSKTAVVHCRRDSYDVYIGRPSKWGNPFAIGRAGDRETVIQKYRAWILGRPDLLADLHELRGKRLGCWCAPQACHGDVLAELADGRPDHAPSQPAPVAHGKPAQGPHLLAPKIDLTTGETLPAVPFRNSLLKALYPDINLAILKADPIPDARPAMIRALRQKHDGLSLDFATGSRKSGEFVATDAAVSRRFWNTPEETVAYGSNLLTDCPQPPITLNLRILVVAKDGEHGTGDCHARMSLALAHELGNEEADRAAQFRLAAGPLLAKGTMLPDISVPSGIDAIIPLSAFKSSHKPETGQHTWTATIAIQGWSASQPTKLSYSILQWLSFDAVEADILEVVQEKAKALVEAGRSTQSAIEFLNLQPTEDDDELLLVRILNADTHEQLSKHPWIVAGITRMLARRWMHLALGAGIHMAGLMAVPDDSLPEATISSPDLPAGPVIATRYPIRSWADVQIWTNTHRPWTSEYNGIVAMSHATAGRLGGDFDGDYFNFLPASEYPAFTAEIQEMHATRSAPAVVKVKERRASTWDRLPAVCLDNADNMVGLIACFIAQANAQNRLDLVDALAPELQIAVDKFKYNLSHDMDLLENIGRQLLPLAWLSDRKSPEAFVSRPIHVEEAEDTISKLARLVAGLWESPELRSAPLAGFAHLLPAPTAHQPASRQLRQRYGKLLAEAIEAEADLGPIFEALQDWAASRPDPEAWASAIWEAVHQPKASGTGSLAFHAFPDQIIAALRKPAAEAGEIAIIGLPYHAWASDLDALNGSREIAIQEAMYRGKARLQAVAEGRIIGFVSAETPISPGLYSASLAWNGNGVVHAAI